MSESEPNALADALASNEYEYVPVDELYEHPENSEIYGEVDPDESFVNDIGENGVETPLIVNRHDDTQTEWGLPNTIIGGHRRLEAARRSGLNAVPVKWEEYPEPLATRRLVKNNNQREKSPDQQAREMLKLEETARASVKEKERRRKSTRPNWDESKSETKRWDVEIADDVGVGKNTVRRATDIYRFAYPEKYVHDDLQNPEKYDVPEEVRDTAREQVEAMKENEQSFHGAYTTIKEAKEEQQKEQTRDAVQQSIDVTTEEPDALDIETGDVIRLGDHRLFCGDSSTDEFRELLPETENAFAFCDPPYGADAADWDGSFVWDHDYLIETAETVAVTPGIESIDEFMRRTGMPYRWSVSAWIDNGMTRGALGFGNWIYVSLFSRADSLHANSQDMARISVSTDDDRPEHKGRKPIGLMTWLYERFVDADTDLIVDPFAGSGTTLLTAEQELDTPVYTADVDREFCSQIVTAWEDLTGGDAEVVR
jgi:ParB-like chromosome segregation protein Spo0J